MHIHASVDAPPAVGDDWADRWQGPDQGAIVSWLRGIEKAAESPELAHAAARGELPILPWRGGVERPLKGQEKIGSILYLAMWQRLRGEPLDLQVGRDETRTCTRTGVTVRYVWDVLQALRGSTTEEDTDHDH